jgi:hypothetical protein
MSSSGSKAAILASVLTSHKSVGRFTLLAAAPLKRCDADQDAARED